MDQPVEYDPQAVAQDAIGEYPVTGEEVEDQVDLLQENDFQKYWRQYRLLNSLLIALFLMVFALVIVWNIIIWVAPEGEARADFSDAGQAPLQKKQQRQQVNYLLFLQTFVEQILLQ